MNKLFHRLANEGVKIRLLKKELAERGVFITQGKMEILYKLKKLKEFFYTK